MSMMMKYNNFYRSPVSHNFVITTFISRHVTRAVLGSVDSLREITIEFPIPPSHNAVQYGTVQYSTVQYSTVQYSTVQCSTVQYSTVQYSTVQSSTVQYCTVQYSTYNTVLYSTVHIYSTVKYTIAWYIKYTII